jgi:hypothetical protein
MKNNWAILLGGNVLNLGVIEKLKSFDLKIAIIDFRKEIVLSCDEHLLYDATNPNVSQYLRHKGYDEISIVYTSMDNAGLTQRQICKDFGLFYAEEEAILNSHYKHMMQRLWEKAGILNRKSFSLYEIDYRKLKEINSIYKIVIKPSDSCASRGITILEKDVSNSMIENAFLLAKKYSSNGIVNIEEYIEGQEYTVEMMGDNYGNVSVFAISKKYHTKNTNNNKIAVKLHYNAQDISNDLQNKIANFAINCYKILGLRNTLGHLEIIVKNNGDISPIEIGARSSGFIASHLVDEVCQKSYLETFKKVLNGDVICNGLIQHKNNSSMYYFYDIPANSISKNNVNLMDYINSNVKSLFNDRSNIVKDRFFDTIKQDTDRYGYEILVGEKEMLTIEEVIRAEKLFLKDFLL